MQAATGEGASYSTDFVRLTQPCQMSTILTPLFKGNVTFGTGALRSYA